MFQAQISLSKEPELTQLLERAGASSLSYAPAQISEELVVVATFSSRPELALSVAYTLEEKNDLDWVGNETVAVEQGEILCPGNVFGNGQHPTTKGALQGLAYVAERYPGITRIADIGCGSGILGISALGLFAEAQVLCLDVDAAAVETARQNVAALGLVGVSVHCADTAAYQPEAPVGLVLMNLPIAVQEQVLPGLGVWLAPGAKVVLSGFTEAWVPVMSKLVQGLGLAMEQDIVVEGWRTWVLRN